MPDFFALPVDGNEKNRKWVLQAADSFYAIGTFDGRNFTPEQSKIAGSADAASIAAQSFSDIPAKDGRRIQIGWWQTETRGMSFNQSMTVPLELRLLSTAEGPRLSWSPVAELQTLRGKSHRFGSMQLTPETANPLSAIRSE